MGQTRPQRNRKNPTLPKNIAVEEDSYAIKPRPKLFKQSSSRSVGRRRRCKVLANCGSCRFNLGLIVCALPEAHPVARIRNDARPFLVVGYHEFGGPPEYAGGPRYDIHGLNIAPDTFRNQLALMEKAGFWPVNMRDIVSGNVTIPKGKVPVVLTFDDGRPTQYRYLSDGSIDPNCAVGILLKFHASHPDWPLRGSFYLIAGSDANGVPFDQEGTEARKVKQLLAWGFEIGNHSLTHPSFEHLSRKQIVNEISGCQAYLRRLVPGIQVSTFALPYGESPKGYSQNLALRQGGQGLGAYLNKAILLFSGGPEPGPASTTFNPYKISRVPPSPGLIENLIRKLSSPRLSQLSGRGGSKQQY
jgi:peptidoglycan/xylan/chitin deacetylase (PgdA/CDA1 family)